MISYHLKTIVIGLINQLSQQWGTTLCPEKSCVPDPDPRSSRSPRTDAVPRPFSLGRPQSGMAYRVQHMTSPINMLRCYRSESAFLFSLLSCTYTDSFCLARLQWLCHYCATIDSFCLASLQWPNKTKKQLSRQETPNSVGGG